MCIRDSLKTMGGIGTALAMLGVIACPITSGDTAFRSARLVLADWLKLDQKSMKNRLILCIPVLGVGAFLGIGNALGKIDYTFMSAVSVTYFLLGNECLGKLINTKTAEGATVYNTAVAYPIGILVAALFLGIFLYTIKKRHTQPHYETLHK